ncbi:MAG TPA: RDD family protein, partial [Gammaproteobacteria bacterium]
MKIVFLCFCLVIGVAGFIIVLNSREEESKLYPGSNVRYWASFPLALVFLTGTVWLFPEQLLHITAVGNYIMLLLWVGIIIVYCAWIESRFQGGMVKRMMHAVVVDKQGKPVDFITALQRNLCKWLLFPLAPLSLHLITRDPRRRALHDKFAKTFVMWAPDMIKANEGQSGYEVEQVYE